MKISQFPLEPVWALLDIQGDSLDERHRIWSRSNHTDCQEELAWASIYRSNYSTRLLDWTILTVLRSWYWYQLHFTDGETKALFKVTARKQGSWGTNPGWSNTEASFHPSVINDSTVHPLIANPNPLHQSVVGSWDHLVASLPGTVLPELSGGS